jgi:AraC-like DNA-binding protein
MISAIRSLRDCFSEPVRIEDLAVIAQMSPSAFHRQFKALTSLTPLQYQKQLRLAGSEPADDFERRQCREGCVLGWL